MDKGAVISEDLRYRYHLWRTWGTGPRMTFIGLNPSTADATLDDPTIRKVVKFAKRLGLSGLDMVNLFAWRATDPHSMLKASEPVGPENDSYLRKFAISSSAVVVAGWGNHGGHRDRAGQVLNMFNFPLFTFGLTGTGQPKHPLYLRDDAPLLELKDEIEKAGTFPSCI